MHAHRLAELLLSHGAVLALFARQWCEQPEDVVQEAFCRLASQRTWPDDPVAWLFRTTKNRALDVAKTAKRRQARESVAARPVQWFAETEIDGLDATAAVAALEQLIPEQRELIVARLWGNMTLEQAAAVFGCAVSTAHRRFEMGIRALQAALGVESKTR